MLTNSRAAVLVADLCAIRAAPGETGGRSHTRRLGGDPGCWPTSEAAARSGFVAARPPSRRIPPAVDRVPLLRGHRVS